jgi:hypothetical protein
VYSQLRWCIDTLGILCCLLGAGLFYGTKRETLWDRDNLVGLILIGIALSTHGGFDTILRSSPHATFSGYVLGFTRMSGSSGWISLYDCGYPPAQFSVDAPHQAVFLPAWRNVPDAVWNMDQVWLLRVTYRTRDLQAERIESEPVPLAKASGMQKWTWQWVEPLLRPILESAIGLALIFGAAVTFLIKRGSSGASSFDIAAVGRDAHS